MELKNDFGGNAKRNVTVDQKVKFEDGKYKPDGKPQVTEAQEKAQRDV